MVLEKAKRLGSTRRTCHLLDSITRLARAYNAVVPRREVLSGGVDANASRSRSVLRALEIEEVGRSPSSRRRSSKPQPDGRVIFESSRERHTNSSWTEDRREADLPGHRHNKSGTRKGASPRENLLQRVWILRKFLSPCRRRRAWSSSWTRSPDQDDKEFIESMNA